MLKTAKKIFTVFDSNKCQRVFSVNEEKITSSQDKITKNLGPVTSPISQGKLVSKVNALTMNSSSSIHMNPQNMVFNNEKGSTLNYKHIVDELVNLGDIDNINAFYEKIYQMISQSIDSSFFAIGLFKEKSNCINLKLQDKLGNNFSTKVFLSTLSRLKQRL